MVKMIKIVCIIIGIASLCVINFVCNASSIRNGRNLTSLNEHRQHYETQLHGFKNSQSTADSAFEIDETYWVLSLGNTSMIHWRPCTITGLKKSFIGNEVVVRIQFKDGLREEMGESLFAELIKPSGTLFKHAKIELSGRTKVFEEEHYKKAGIDRLDRFMKVLSMKSKEEKKHFHERKSRALQRRQ